MAAGEGMDPNKKGNKLKIYKPVGQKYVVRKADNMNYEYDLTKAIGRIMSKRNAELVDAGVQTYTPLFFTNSLNEASQKFTRMVKV